MKFICFLCHTSLDGKNMDCYGPYAEFHVKAGMYDNALKKVNAFFNDGTYKLVAQVEYTYDPEKQTFSTEILSQKMAPPPKIVELNVAAKKDEKMKKKPTKKAMIPPPPDFHLGFIYENGQIIQEVGP